MNKHSKINCIMKHAVTAAQCGVRISIEIKNRTTRLAVDAFAFNQNELNFLFNLFFFLFLSFGVVFWPPVPATG